MRRMRFLPSQWSHTCIYLAAVISHVFCKTCPPLKSESVDIVCEFEGDVIDCESPVIRGSTARLACKHSYKIPLAEDPGYRDLTCLSDGSWSHPLFNCIPECGTAVAHGTPLIINGRTATRGAFPWHVAIYERSPRGSFVQICAGTLVSANLVISAAHCFYDDTLKKLQIGTDFAVAAGKFYRSYDTPESSAEKSAVKKIDIPERYSGYSRNFQDDIALVHLETSFSLTTLIRPVCMDWNNEYERDQLKGGNNGKIVGWGRTETGFPSPELQEIDLPFTNYGPCINAVPEDFKEFVTADKFCAGYLNGSSLCDGDSGGGLSFQLNGRWYLRGVASVGPVDEAGRCEKNYFTAFTNVGKFLDWIRKIHFKVGIHQRDQEDQVVAPATPESCVLPEQPQNGNFKLHSCKNRCDASPGSRVPIGSYLIYECNEGYNLSGIGVSFCHEAGWYSSPTCIGADIEATKRCPALRSRTLNLECDYKGEKVSCESSMSPGTKAQLACKEYYKKVFANDPGYTEITCLEDGVWDRPVFRCVPECGTYLHDGGEVKVNSLAVKHDKFPWRVNFYKKDTAGSYEWSSDGILISPDLVVTRADAILDEEGGKGNESVWELSAGEYYDVYDKTEPLGQRTKIKSLDFAKDYKGEDGNLAHNIVLVRLQTPFNITAVIRPICVDWAEVVGFQANESADISATHFGYDVCYEQVVDEHKIYLAEDGFCTDCNYNVNSCTDANQGGSFICEYKGLWYMLGRLRRRVLIKDESCDWYYSYTRLRPYLKWIRDAYDLSVF